MKKIIKIIGFLVFAFAACVVILSCAKKKSISSRKPDENVDSSKWIDNLIDGKFAAQKENKKLLLFFSADDSDEASIEFKNNLFNTQEFIDYATKEYVLVNLDFSDSLFAQTQIEDDFTSEQKKAADSLYAKLNENLRDATMYNVTGSPTFFILTKEGYVVTELIFEQIATSIDDFKNLLETEREQIDYYFSVFESASSGNKLERIESINELFSITDVQHRYLLADLSRYVVENDKNNESGSVSAHIFAIANANAVQAYLDDDSEGASKEFAKAAENKFLSPEEKQQCYYTAGYLFAQSGATDYKKIKDYFQKAYDAAPESENAAMIIQMVNMFDEDYSADYEADFDSDDEAETDFEEAGNISETNVGENDSN